jgi:hypothetical protein
LVEVAFALCSEEFRRGDANVDGAVNIADPIFILQWLFAGGPDPLCKDGADANDDGAMNISDPIYILQWQFVDGPDIPPPGPYECGPDPTEDNTPCEFYPAEKC